MRPRRGLRIAFRWLCIIGGLALASAALLVVYGVALVDRSLSAGARTSCVRILSAPLYVRAGDPWTMTTLARALALRGFRAVERAAPGPGEFAASPAAVDLHGGRGASPESRVRITAGAAGVRIEDDGGRAIAGVALPPTTIGTSTAYGVIRWPVSLAEIAPALLTAVVDTEDRTFLSHAGLSLRGMVRAAWRDLRAGGVREGGSTITQQLAKNLLLRPVRSVPRKVLEAWLATLIEYRYDKRVILEAYLNRVYLGQDGGVQIQGIEAAAHYYCGRRAAALSLEEAALLAGMVAAPNRFDPFSDPDEARSRRSLVLRAMVREGHLAEAARVAAESVALPGRPHRLRWPPAIHYAERAAAQRADLGELPTWLEVDVQDAVAEGCAAGLRRLERRFPRLRGAGSPLQAAVAVVAADGRVLALTGSRDGSAGEFNRATGARRPIGSLVKPFVVAAALEAGRTLDDDVEDSPLSVPVAGGAWAPQNSDGKFRGTVTVREALVQSLNVPIVRLGLEVSLARVENALRRVGFDPPAGRPAILLGAVEASPLDVARAYATLVGGGFTPTAVMRRGERQERRAAMPAAVAAAVVEALTEVPRRGTAWSLGATTSGWLAAKTGTTDDRRDSWFVALRPGFVTVVWVGFDDNRETGLYGATGALEVWREIDGRLAPPWRG